MLCVYECGYMDEHLLNHNAGNSSFLWGILGFLQQLSSYGIV